MLRPTDLRTCHVQKNVRDTVDVNTPDGPVAAQSGDYILTDADSTQWVFTETELKAIARVKPPRLNPGPPPQVIPKP